MSIYDKPVRSLMRDMVDEFALQKGASFTKKQAIDWFATHYSKIKTGTITAHLIKASTNAPSRLHYNAKEGEDDILFQIDGSHFRLYDPSNDPSPIQDGNGGGGGPGGGEEPVEPPEPPGSTEFAYESDLKNYLSKNLPIIEIGLTLYEDEGIRGIEFPVGGRFVDILAVDQSGDLVVIELKVSRGYDRVVGQLMRYMAWIGENQANPEQKVRGVIVARKITNDLLLACSLMPMVQLFEYQLSLAVREVAPGQFENEG